jgi:hypothetical protein
VHWYAKVPRELKTREMIVSPTTLMSAGAPAGDVAKITSWPVPSGANAMLKRRVLPTPTVTVKGLNASPGVKMSTVVGAGDVGEVGGVGALSEPLHAASVTVSNTRVARRACIDSRFGGRDSLLKEACMKHTTVGGRWFLVVVAAAFALSACGSNTEAPTSPTQPVTPTQPTTPVTPPTPADTALVGVFNLSTVNANTLPATILSDSAYSLAVVSATMTMQTGGHFVLAIATRETVDGNVSLYSDTTTGTWSATGSTITLTRAADGSVFTATWDGTHLAVTQMDDTAKDIYLYLRAP